jgi:hypothetical protein
MINTGVQLLIRIDPLPVKIYTCQVASGIPIYDTVWIEHRDYLEDKVVSKNASAQTGTHKVVNYTLDHKRGPSLTRVHSGGNHNSLSLPNLFGIVIGALRSKRCHNKHVDIVPS